MNNLPLGARFLVVEPTTFCEGADVVACYQPTLGPYSVTERNRAFVISLVKAGKAAIVGWAPPRPPAGLITVEDGANGSNPRDGA